MKPWIAGLCSVIFALVPVAAFAQAAAAAAPKAPPSNPASMATAMPAKVEAAQQNLAQVAPATPMRRSRAHEDARECLGRGSNYAITKCAEKYL